MIDNRPRSSALVVKPSIRTAQSNSVLAASATILLGVAATALFLPAGSSAEIFSVAAIGVGLSLCAGTAIEATAGVRRLLGVDLLILWLLYGLTFFEFLFPQSGVEGVVSTAAAVNGTNAVLIGFASLVIGRHLTRSVEKSPRVLYPPVKPASIFTLFLLATLLGYLYVLIAVRFDPFEIVRQMSLPRFSQSWSRGRYGGDIFTLLVEVGALSYLIPPVGGLILARSRDYTGLQKVIVLVVVLFTFWFGFASGTRNIIVTYVITFFGAYFLNKPKLQMRDILFIGLPAAIVLLLGTVLMLEFRNVGVENITITDSRSVTVFIDHNMVTISRLTDLFPDPYGYLGFEIPFHSLVHPIPRILWPGKPEGLSVDIVSAFGFDPSTVTFAATFIGEAYMSGGLPAIVLAGVLLGGVASMWNRISLDVNSPFAQLLYASGFFCAALTMRSMAWMSVTMLPTLALWIYGKLVLVPSRRRVR